MFTVFSGEANKGKFVVSVSRQVILYEVKQGLEHRLVSINVGLGQCFSAWANFENHPCYLCSVMPPNRKRHFEPFSFYLDVNSEEIPLGLDQYVEMIEFATEILEGHVKKKRKKRGKGRPPTRALQVAKLKVSIYFF